MQKFEKLYIVTRRDLRPGLQAAQVAHAAFVFMYEHRPLATQWFQDSNYVVILSVANEKELEDRGELLDAKGIPIISFREPDLDSALTAIAVAPSPMTVELMSDLPLAFSEYATGEWFSLPQRGRSAVLDELRQHLREQPPDDTHIRVEAYKDGIRYAIKTIRDSQVHGGASPKTAGER